MRAFVGNRVKDLKWWLIASLAIVALGLFYFVFFGTTVAPFKLEDNCGILINLESHPIPDEDACRLKCRGQCVSKDLDFKKVEFAKPEAGCNECICHCK